MNTILESPLEVLVFNYWSVGFFFVVNNVWTWVAVITAAVSFWRIKTSAMLPQPGTHGYVSTTLSTPPPPPTMMVSSSSSSSTAQVENVSKETTNSTATTLMYSSDAAFTLVKEEGTKGKLTVYFKQDVGGEREDYGNSDEEGEDDGVELCKEWFKNWERVMEMRRGEMGWYCYQDTKVIDGNVVRLWDGCKRRRKAEATTFSVDVVSAWWLYEEI